MLNYQRVNDGHFTVDIDNYTLGPVYDSEVGSYLQFYLWVYGSYINI